MLLLRSEDVYLGNAKRGLLPCRISSTTPKTGRRTCLVVKSNETGKITLRPPCQYLNNDRNLTACLDLRAQTPMHV